MQLVKGTKCIVVGLGVSGMAAVRFLHDRELQVSVSEYRRVDQIDGALLSELRKLDIALETGGHTDDFFRNAKLIVPSPGVPLDLPIIKESRKRGAVIAGELAIAADRVSSPVIGVTGSNGKTTVTSLIGHLLQAGEENVFVGGNIGTPVLEYLCGPQDARALVLELSSFQLEISGEFRPDIALLLNLSPDHIDRHGTLEKYAAAKQRIFTNQGPGDVAIIGSDDVMVMRERITTAGRVLRFGVHPSSEALVQDNGVLIRGKSLGTENDEYYDLSETALSSFVNRLNAAAAILAARVYGSTAETIRKGLSDYTLFPHRMSPVAEIDGVKYVDDSKGTNIGAVTAALASCGKRIILIAGGRDKDNDFSLLSESIRHHVLQMVLIGEAAGRIEEQLGGHVPVLRAGSMEEAVAMATDVASPGDTVLLSPGCASFDMFTGYVQRGEAFQQAVQGLRKISHDCC